MGTSVSGVLLVAGVVSATWHYAGFGGAMSVLVLAFLWALNDDTPVQTVPDDQGDGHLPGTRTYRFGFSCMQGRRDYMEDFHQIDYFEDSGEAEGNISHFFAVYDGHCGPKAAAFAKKKLANNVLAAAKELGADTDDRVREAIRSGFLKTDTDFCATAEVKKLNDGSTACCVLMQEKKQRLWIANVGDSRAILVQRSGKALALSRDHKPDRDDERARIERAGGCVKMYGCARVDGILAVSRAFGDRMLKHHGVCADPEISHHDLSHDDRYLVIASDGLWDVFTNDEVAEVVTNQPDVEQCAKVLTEGANRKGSMDNVTVVIVQLWGE